MKPRKTLTALVVTLLSAGMLLMGCTGPAAAPTASPSTATAPPATQSPATTAPTQAPAPTSKTYSATITVELMDAGGVPASEGTVDDNRWTRYYQEEMQKIGITIEWLVIPRAQEVDKLTVLMASGDAPDLVMTYDRNVFLQYAKMGGLTALDDLLEENAPDIISYFGMDQLQYGTYHGSIYAIPARRASFALGGAFIRQDWLDELGLPMPDSVDAFYDTMVAFKQNPDKLNAAEVYPVGMCSSYLGTAVGGNNGMSTVMLAMMDTPTEEQLACIPAYLWDGYADYLAFENKLYLEGMFNKEFAIDSGGTVMKEDYLKNKIGYVEGHSSWVWMGNVQYMLQQVDENARAVGFGGLPNRSGDTVIQEGTEVGFYNVIPSTSKNPDAVLAYLNWECTIGGPTVWFGLEGEHFNYDADGVKIPIDPAYNANSFEYIRANLVTLYNMTADPDPAMQEKLLKSRFGGDQGDDYLAAMQLFRANGLRSIYVDKVDADETLGDSVDLNTLSTDLGTLANDRIAAIIMAPAGSDIQAMYQAFYDDYMAAGGQQYIDGMIAIYKAQYGIQ